MLKRFSMAIVMAVASLSGTVALAATQTLPSGVEVTHEVVGTGKTPTASSTVEVHYTGTLRDGTVFDSSHSRGKPLLFPLNRVIPCWTQGVATMAEGGKAKLFCPSATAYGNRGAGNMIPPDTDLFFDVELIKVQ